MQFGALNKDTASAPIDPGSQPPIAPCNELRSYFYSSLSSTDRDLAVLASRLEVRSSANYGTGSHLTLPSRIPDIIAAQKSTVPDTALDQIYVISIIR